MSSVFETVHKICQDLPRDDCRHLDTAIGHLLQDFNCGQEDSVITNQKSGVQKLFVDASQAYLNIRRPYRLLWTDAANFVARALYRHGMLRAQPRRSQITRPVTVSLEARSAMSYSACFSRLLLEKQPLENNL